MSSIIPNLVKRVAGDVIIIEDHNNLVDSIWGLFEYNDITNTPQPIQAVKPSILVLLVEGSATVGFPNTTHVYISSDNIVFYEVGALGLPRDGLIYAQTLTVPVPKDFYISWIAPYGFVKNAVLF